MYEDGTPGEIFIKMSKEGSAISGLMDSFAIAVSIAMQCGVPLKDLASKFINSRFEPAGVTSNPEIRFAKSLVDYIFKWLSLKFLTGEELAILGLTAPELHPSKQAATEAKAESEAKSMEPYQPPATSLTQFIGNPSTEPVVQTKELTSNDLSKTMEKEMDAPPCPECGAFMVRNGACYKCLNCGATSGCS
jgi:ribonucleoside-diphosphate reductase alpha chain